MDNEIQIDGLELEKFNTPIDDLEVENVHLTIVEVDESGSMKQYEGVMRQNLEDFKDALTQSKEVDEMLIARGSFASNVSIGGYKKVEEFGTTYNAMGITKMYDAIVEGVDKLLAYRALLKSESMRVKAVFAVFSDGEDQGSASGFQQAKEAIKKLNDEEITTAFICFGDDAKREATDLGFMNILDVNNSTASDLRKAFDCLSKSVIASSKSVLSNTDNFFV